jgi:hypothetical protein
MNLCVERSRRNGEEPENVAGALSKPGHGVMKGILAVMERARGMARGCSTRIGRMARGGGEF